MPPTRSFDYGHVRGVPVGTIFRNRQELVRAGVHAQNQAGIHGDSREGAYSICISGGYEDNKDHGETITYVGSGGQSNNGEQIANQSFDDPRNRSLFVSYETRRPVRVIRGRNPTSHYAPSSGYRYDGLYTVTLAQERPGHKGFSMCFFELQRLREPGDRPIPTRRTLTLQKMQKMRRRAPRA